MPSNTDVISAGLDTSTIIGWEERSASSTMTGNTSLMSMMSRWKQKQNVFYMTIHCLTSELTVGLFWNIFVSVKNRILRKNKEKKYYILRSKLTPVLCLATYLIQIVCYIQYIYNIYNFIILHYLASGMPIACAHHSPVGLCLFHSNIFKETGKAFIQPQVIPPVHGHNISKPLQIKDKHCLNCSSKIIHNPVSFTLLYQCICQNVVILA